MSTVEYGLKCRTGAEAGTQCPDVSDHCVQPRSTSEALPSLASGPGTTGLTKEIELVGGESVINGA